MDTDPGKRSSSAAKWLQAAAVLVCMAVAAGVALLSINWPFTEHRIAESLGSATGCNVRARQFRATFFPFPGCVIDEVDFERGRGSLLANADRITVQSTWGALLTLQRRVNLLRAEGLRVRITKEVPPPVERRSKKQTDTTIAELVADGAVLDIVAGKNDAPVHFAISKLTLNNVGKREPLTFAVMLRGSHVPGDVQANGSFGPWKQKDTPLSGSYRLANADLSRYRGIAGLLNSSGGMKGTLSRLTVKGEADTAAFAVNNSPNTMRLRTAYLLMVDGFTGDVVIDRAQSSFLRTTLDASGKIAGANGKTAAVDFDGRSARVEDLLRMFTRNPSAALKGPIRLQAHVELPPGPGEFLKKLRLDGRFSIDHAEFTRETTQSKLNQISARARAGENAGENKDDPAPSASVVSEMKAVVSLRQGVAHLSNVSFRVPGAHATGAGYYNVLTKRIDLRGNVALDASLSEASGGGWKSILLKPLNFVFRKEHAGAVVPVSMTGSYPKPKLQVSLAGRK